MASGGPLQLPVRHRLEVLGEEGGVVECVVGELSGQLAGQLAVSMLTPRTARCFSSLSRAASSLVTGSPAGRARKGQRSSSQGFTATSSPGSGGWQHAAPSSARLWCMVRSPLPLRCPRPPRCLGIHA